MGGVALGGPGRRRAAAVHKEIYALPREKTTPGEKKDLQGRAAPRGYRLPGMGSHADWGYPEREGYSSVGYSYRGDGCVTLQRGARVICDSGAGLQLSQRAAGARSVGNSSESAGMSQRGLGPAPSGHRCGGPCEILPGARRGRAPLPRAVAIVRLSPHPRRWWAYV